MMLRRPIDNMRTLPAVCPRRCISVAIEREDRLLNSGLLVWTGLLSYSLYLWQQPFLVFDGPLNYFSVRILMTFLMAYLSYRFIEQSRVLNLYARRRSETHAARPCSCGSLDTSVS